jgi:anthranilate phosphoribosyltransferase
MLDGKASPVQVGAVLTALRLKGEIAEELHGFARAVLERTTLKLQVSDVIDTCGTGGDHQSTFNISTASAFVVAAAGTRVAKHVAPRISSRAGSLEVLQELGVPLSVDCAGIDDAMDAHRLAFVSRERALPAFEALARTAAALELRTTIDVITPMVSPMTPRYQLLGAHSETHMLPMAQALGELGRERVWVVRGNDGVDELSLSATSKVVAFEGGAVNTFTIDPRDHGLEIAPPESVRGGGPKENAAMLREVLEGKRPGPLTDIVLLNAGAALFIANAASSLHRGIDLARETLLKGEARELLARLTA